MDLQQLQSIGAFAPTKLTKKTIEVERPVTTPQEDWDDPEIPEFTGEVEKATLETFIRYGSSADDIEIARADERDQPFVAIFRFICNKNGTPVFESVEQAARLKSWLTVPLFAAIAEVRGTLPKSSKRKMSSGSKSP